jgi:hypothetical protein
VYWIDEVRITNPDLCRQMLRTGRSSEELGETALKDWKDGGRGRANAMFAAPLDSIRAAYLKLTPEERCEPLKFEGFILSSNVPAILDGLDSPKYESIV